MTLRVNRSQAMLMAAGAVTLALAATLAPQAQAQGWWPWANNDGAPPRPREPVYRGPPPAPIPGAPVGSPIPAQPAPGARPQGQAANICLQLEQQLVSESQRGGSNPRETMAKMETEIRLLERQQAQAQSQLENGSCYEYFLFSKSLKNTPACRNAATSAEQLRNRIRDLDTQRGQMAGKSERSVRDDVIRELARNGCGQRYADEARRLDSKGFGLWSTEEDGGHKGNQFGSLPFATYRTVCVRLCDGYFFPVSFSTLPNHFQRDSESCQSKCAAPVELYYHPNPGGDMKQAMSAKQNAPYTSLKSAFRYTKEYVHGCSCKEAEYQPGAGERRADMPGATPTGAVAKAAPKQP